MQRYFGLNFDDVENGKISVMQAASCAAYLPIDGAVACALNGDIPVWGFDTHLLADTANNLRWLVWAKTKNGQKNRNRPKMHEPPAVAAEKPELHEIDEVKEILDRKRV